MADAAAVVPAAPPPFTLLPAAPYHLVSPFAADADAMRAAIDSHFGQPERHGRDHQVWNYWYVPDSYTYLRTSPEKVLGPQLAQSFHDRITRFVREHFGMETVTWPYLSLYVEGCGQTLHNDSRNGAFGYVYSLTHWDTRPFQGGETLLFREQDYWASGRFREAGAGTSFYEVIPSRFNQLLVFDDRLIHGVSEVRGTTNPSAGRIVLHGHLQVKNPFAEGPLAETLPALLQQGLLGDVIGTVRARIAREAGRWHGFATCEMVVAPDGHVQAVRPLVQRVLGREGPVADVPALAELHEALRALRFGAQAGPSRIVVPVFFE